MPETHSSLKQELSLKRLQGPHKKHKRTENVSVEIEES